ncbi:MAG: hypothetical protein QOI96_282 [Verrucomicrobiota bacterium]
MLRLTRASIPGSARGPRAASGGPPDELANVPFSKCKRLFGEPPKRTREPRVLPSTAIFARAISFALYALLAHRLCAAPIAQKLERNPDTEIRKVIQAQQEAWNRGDIDGFMNGYARGNRRSGSDSTTFVSEDTIRRGWQTVRDRYKKKYSDREKMGVLTFSDLEITSLGHDAAVALGRWKLKRAQDEPHGRFTLIFRRTPEGWRIIHDHTSAAK